MFFKLFYCIKTNLHILLSFVFSFVCFVFAFYRFIPDIVQDFSQYRLYSNVSTNEVWFAENYVSNDCFINLNGICFAYSNDKSINTDIYMQMDSSYSTNPFRITERLNDSTCAISQNIASEYHLNVNDSIYINDNKNVFKICRIIPSQVGLDEKYNHQGIIVISYAEELYIPQPTKYIFFTKDGDGFSSVTNYIRLDNLAKKYKKEAIQKTLYISIILVLVFIIVETLTYRKKKHNNALLFLDGNKHSHILLLIIFDSFIQATFPLLFVFLCFIKYLSSFQTGYCIVFIILISLSIVLSLLSSIIDYKGGKKHGSII